MIKRTRPATYNNEVSAPMPSSPDSKYATATPLSRARIDMRTGGAAEIGGAVRTGERSRNPLKAGQEKRKGSSRRRSQDQKTSADTHIRKACHCFNFPHVPFHLLHQLHYPLGKKQQFVSQLIDFGDSLVRIAGSNAADKILGRRNCPFPAGQEPRAKRTVLFAVITDHKKIVRAHSRMRM